MKAKRAKRAATALSGVLLLDKPQGWTSHDLVAKLRALTGEGRIGHCGTLDPDATGLMVMLVGPATRLSDNFIKDTKSYRARICFGTATTTDDAAGDVVDSSPVPATVFQEDWAHTLLLQFTGEQDQIPPDFSALKVDGKVGYREARKGRPLQQPARQIKVHCADLREIDQATSSWVVDFTVSKGSYIRAIARDIGHEAGTHAHLCELRRVASGEFDLERAHSIAEVADTCADDPLAIADYFLSREVLTASVPEARLNAAGIAGSRVGPCVLTIGVFDGVHLGHQALLKEVANRAQERGLLSAVLTFDVHPNATIRPSHAPQTLMSLSEKVATIEACGIDQVIVLPFTHALSQQSATEFLLKTMPTVAQVREIIVGSDFRCGKGATCGSIEMQEILDMEITVFGQEVDSKGIPYSSTRIREGITSVTSLER